MASTKANPTAGNGGAQHVSVGDFNGASSIAQRADVLLKARRHDYGLLVTFERSDGRVCSQVYAGNIAAAERKLSRVRSRSLAASMTLVRLVPVASNIEPAGVLGGDADE